VLELIRVAADLQDFCEARDWRFCFIDEHLGPLAALKEAPEILTELANRRAEFEC